MDTLHTIKPHVRSINAPSGLRQIPGWLMWRIEHDEQGKKLKVPYYTSGEKRTGQNGSPGDRSRLTTFEAARTAAARRGMDGVGLALMPEFDLTVLDFDDCVVNGEVDSEVIAMVGDTYAEMSPSGTGVHAIYRGLLGNQKSYSTPDRWGFETFSNRGFVTFSGNTLEIVELLGLEDTIAPLNSQVLAEHQRRFGRSDAPREASSSERLGLTVERVRQAVSELDPDLGFEHWLRVGMGIHHELGAEGFGVWDEWSSKGSKYRGSDNLMTHWRTFGRQRNGEPVTMRSIGKMLGRPLDAGPASAEEFESLVNAETNEEGEPEPLRFQIIGAHEFASVAPQPWRIKGVLPEAELVVMYGASGSGKSFMALDMGAAIARGVEWRGKRVRQGRVAYIAAEGAGGFRKRLTAYAQANQFSLEDLDMGVIHAAPNMMDKADAAAVAKAVKAWGGADLIIVDTFAQVMPGANENAGEDVGKALTHCKHIHAMTGAMIMLIHHSGKDATKGARGWSGLRAAADAELEVVRTDQGRSLRLTKSKDGEDGLEWGFELQIVPIGVDEDLEPITSCVVIEATLPAAGGPGDRKLNKNQHIVHSVIQEMLAVQSEGIEVSAILDESVRRMMARDGLDKDAKGNCRGSMRKALNSLCEENERQMYVLDVETNCVGAL